MSEAFNHHPENENVGPITQDTNPEQERIDFSEVGPELAVSYLFSELRHPARKQLRGLELAAYLDSELTSSGDGDPTSHNSRLVRLMMDAPDDDNFYDRKYEQDHVFHQIVDELRATMDSSKSLAAQRHAMRQLMQLRLSFPEITTRDDDEWISVIGRLLK